MEYLHTMIRVRNLDDTLKFFCQGLGFVEIRRKDHERGRFTLVFLAAPGDAEAARHQQAPLLELTHNWDDEVYTGGRNFGHVAYRVDNLYGVCRHLIDLGVTLHRPPRDGHMAFVRSPDGISVELLQKGDPLPVQEPWSSMKNVGTW